MAASPSPNDLTRQQLDELDVLLQRMLALPISQPEPAVAFPPPPPLPDLPPVAPRPAPRETADPSSTTWRADTHAPSKVPHLTHAPEPAVAFTPSVLPFQPVARSQPEPPAPRPVPPPPAPRLFTPPPVRETVPPTPFVAPEPTPAEPMVSPGTLRGVDAPALPFDFTPADPNPTPSTADVTSYEFPEVNPFADPVPPLADNAPTPSAPPVPVFLWPMFGMNWLLEFALGWFGPVGHVLTRPAMKTMLGWLGVLLILGAGVWAARGMGWVSWPR